jgi:hypothetical protein
MQLDTDTLDATIKADPAKLATLIKRIRVLNNGR